MHKVCRKYGYEDSTGTYLCKKVCRNYFIQKVCIKKAFEKKVPVLQVPKVPWYGIHRILPGRGQKGLTTSFEMARGGERGQQKVLRLYLKIGHRR